MGLSRERAPISRRGAYQPPAAAAAAAAAGLSQPAAARREGPEHEAREALLRKFPSGARSAASDTEIRLRRKVRPAPPATSADGRTDALQQHHGVTVPQKFSRDLRAHRAPLSVARGVSAARGGDGRADHGAGLDAGYHVVLKPATDGGGSELHGPDGT
jgi:hypothetical protein